MTLDVSAFSWTVRALLVLVCAVLALLVLAPRLERGTFFTAAIGLLAAAATIACGVQDVPGGRFALVVTGAITAVAMLLLHASELQDDRQRPECAALILVGSIGAIVLATGVTLLEIAIGVEMLSLSAAALVALGKGTRPLEAGFKYFLLTAVTFASLLFGMSLVFLGNGSVAIPSAATGIVAAGVALIVIGLAFKLAVVPVHFGALDAYTAGPSSFVGFIMIASKLGAALALVRIVAAAGPAIEQLVLGLGLLTIGFGVLASFAQTDLRRLLAYSAVAHAGFIAVAAASPVGGADAARFYVLNYGAAAALAFAALAGTGTDGFSIARLGSGDGGLGRARSALLLLSLLSLAGVPPLPGFWAKLAVLVAVWKSWGTLATSLVALGGVIGIIYYLKPMPDLLAQSRRAGVNVVALLLALVVLGLAFLPLFAWRFSSIG
jgi:NADH-quinone oxidoreductase subunit N